MENRTPKTDLERRDWFSVPVWTLRLQNADTLNKKLLERIRQLHVLDEGIRRSNIGGWQGRPLFFKEEAARPLLHHIAGATQEIATTLAIDMAKSQFMVTEMWPNVSGSGAFHASHIHPNATFSGVYYVATPPKSGAITFTDPITARSMAKLPVSASNALNTEQVSYTPEPGLLILFPSWLSHAVGQNQSAEDRVSISFNISYHAGRG